MWVSLQWFIVTTPAGGGATAAGRGTLPLPRGTAAGDHVDD